MSRELRLEVPLAKSSRSTSAVRSPRIAASRAVPQPVIPPPITSRSSVPDPIASSAAARDAASNGARVTPAPRRVRDERA